VVASATGMNVVPSNSALSAAELGLVSALNRESALASILKPAEANYDYILIDCLPSLGLLAINALRAASGIVIPVQADFLAVQGLAQILETIGAVREQLNPALAVYGVLLTMVDLKKSHSQRVVATVRHSLKGHVPVFETEIAQHVSFKEAAEAGVSILDHQKNGAGADTYRHLAREVGMAAGDASVASFELHRAGFLAGAGRFFRSLIKPRAHTTQGAGR